MSREITSADKALARQAQGKQLAGKKLTRQETQALARVRKQMEEEARWQHYGSIPKGHYCKLAGRQQKVVDEQARRYDLPLIGPNCNLAQVLSRFHDLLAQWGPRMLQAEEESEMLGGETSPALERWREEKFLLARIERREKERRLIPIDLLNRYMQLFASQLRTFGERLQKHYGPAALDAWHEHLEAMETIQSEFLDAQETETEVDDPDSTEED